MVPVCALENATKGARARSGTVESGFPSDRATSKESRAGLPASRFPTDPALGLQGPFDAPDKGVPLKRFQEEANSATRKRPFLKARLMARRDHDHWHRNLACREVPFEFDAAHARHLDVGDDANRARDHTAPEEFLGGGEAARIIAGGSNQTDKGAQHGLVIVDNGN